MTPASVLVRVRSPAWHAAYETLADGGRLGSGALSPRSAGPW